MTYDREQVRTMIRDHATRAGNLRKLSIAWKIPYAYISAALHTDRSPSPQILAKLGLRRITVTRYTDER